MAVGAKMCFLYCKKEVFGNKLCISIMEAACGPALFSLEMTKQSVHEEVDTSCEMGLVLSSFFFCIQIRICLNLELL